MHRKNRQVKNRIFLLCILYGKSVKRWHILSTDGREHFCIDLIGQYEGEMGEGL